MSELNAQQTYKDVEYNKLHTTNEYGTPLLNDNDDNKHEKMVDLEIGTNGRHSPDNLLEPDEVGPASFTEFTEKRVFNRVDPNDIRLRFVRIIICFLWILSSIGALVCHIIRRVKESKNEYYIALDRTTLFFDLLLLYLTIYISCATETKGHLGRIRNSCCQCIYFLYEVITDPLIKFIIRFLVAVFVILAIVLYIV